MKKLRKRWKRTWKNRENIINIKKQSWLEQGKHKGAELAGEVDQKEAELAGKGESYRT